MIKINDNERRDFFRIDDDVYLDYASITEEEYKAAPETLRNLEDSAFSLSANFATLNNSINPILNNIKQLHPDIGEYLEALNSKIDRLSQHIHFGSSDFDNEKVYTANISASGIQFETDQSFQLQQAMKLELVLLPEKVGVLIFGRVVDVKAKCICIEFEHLRNEDQELMIKHNLNRQMNELREKNNNN
ncbi:MAG: hypothetical protein DIZ80_02590 [endosymbiont of Galathealinum brachiosum]|uniref:PilZ domain-containing protein n=1 Tax=endosymbiont of Galathealinum brachiosum TaxID=2200906 RepID=A0A370DM07_9GAMM|nr:MAG: hypothetical protein DIZ80_02590 [endosymbiont of Galathealinum brachiosum]